MNDKTKNRMHAVAAVFKTVGLLTLLSAGVMNPWVGKYWRDNIINFQDVLLQYCLVATGLGLLILAVGLCFPFVKSRIFHNLSLLFVTLSIFALFDRFSLAVLGLPLWMPDMENHYRHRPHVLRSWGRMYDNKLIMTNLYGHHDDDFAVKKTDREFRALILGDSITMGHGVTREQTFSNQLEILLQKSGKNQRRYQVINTGVQGYSTFQEFHELKRSLIFQPDFVAVGFCMNDVQEPFMINRNFGGVGIDYHGVTQVFNYYLSYLLNETGYGRLIQTFRSRPERAEWSRVQEIQDVKYMVSHTRDDPAISDGWDLVLHYLEEIYSTSRKEEINVVLLIFPHIFQLMDEGMKHPQKILYDHAKRHGVDVLDFTTVFEELTSGRAERINRYFLDFDHYTVEGHQIVASRIYQYLADKGYLE